MERRVTLVFILLSFIIGLCGSFFGPLSSLFIVEELGATPIMLSAYMVTAVSCSVIVSQYMARRSDRGWKRKRILLISLISNFILVFSFTLVREYYLALLIVAIFGSISGAGFGQLFALAREYGDECLKDGRQFLATMRAGTSVAWVFGAPIAFMVKASFGFAATFSISAFIVLLAIYITYKSVPNCNQKNEVAVMQVGHVRNALLRFDVLLYSSVIILAFSANSLYLTTMPLYLSQELMLDDKWFGVLFGVAALFEIPAMILSGRLARAIGSTRVMLLGTISGVVFFSLMLLGKEVHYFVLAQVFNGIFVGTCAALGMVAMQDMMKNQLGVASTLFSNLLQISSLLGGAFVGIVGQLVSYYANFYLSLILISLSALLLCIFCFVVKPSYQYS
ncbi:MFS transporter [Photobacterium gaetbulicola]|uniref:Sugar efflux system n=1 Tax=Photobacterium gaetbulicola Gung47 TaxID=658445 RepID=A0A0C5WST3_9GAMM|nr:sugar efflux transporter [Photobacterium gaetbulicola]AJR09467.1 sugar efflux system [Photobacterium gaetbulicola Gung47]PSU14266.1 MFS transporter [Photobacterium gaetbulicola]